MKEGQRLWTKDELTLAVNLYCKLPFGKMHSRNNEIIKLSELINRTPSSVALKLGNFASFDLTLKARGIKGAPNASKLDKQVWDEFFSDWSSALLNSEELLAKKQYTTIEKLNEIDLKDLDKKGLNQQRLVNTRINQSIFWKMILATYNNRCCITAINKIELLTASHIVAWNKDEKNRLNPTNGLCLNALHDKAFDNGLLTISADDYHVKISSKLKTSNPTENIQDFFLRFEGRNIKLPDKFLPGKEFLKIHNDFFKP